MIRRKTVQVPQFIISYLVLIGIALLGGEMIAHHLVGLTHDRKPEIIRIERKISFTTVIKTKLSTNKTIPSTSPSPTPSITINHTQPVTWTEFKDIATDIAKEEDYPISVLLGQAALESARGTSPFARNRFNYFGICAYDSDPNQACAYASVEDGIKGYIYLIKTDERYARAWKKKKYPKIMIAEIKNAGYASDKEYVEKVTGTPEFKEFANY